MVKHIDRVKIERAAGCQSVIHSYSGARVEQVSSKIKEYWSEGEQYDTVLLHVGTNNLASEEPEEVASKMDGLIKDLKDHAKKIAISSVIKRYDNRVPASKITRFNNFVKNLCMKHNTTFLDNDHIDRSLLNRSNLRLNQQGDRVLGSVFCAYLKSFRVGNNRQFFHQAHIWTSEQRMDNVLEIFESNNEELDSPISVNNVSSDFFTSLNSIPNERGFKMAFLNIVSLPKKIDEIRYSMSNKLIDLIAFNETRLDSSITNGMIHLNDYDIIRKDRSRNGGGVCIYLRSSINYIIRQDLISSELEAVCVEIIKPHSRPFLVTTIYRRTTQCII